MSNRVYSGDRHVRRGGDDYAEAWSNLLPTGLAWPRDTGTILMKITRGLGQAWGNWVDRRAADLLEQETDPRLTLEMLSDWERAWGLPDNCFLGVGQTIDQRRRFLMLKMTLEGGQSRAWFTWVCEQLGESDITIKEFAPFMVGISRVGDTRTQELSTNLFVGAFARPAFGGEIAAAAIVPDSPSLEAMPVFSAS